MTALEAGGVYGKGSSGGNSEKGWVTLREVGGGRIQVQVPVSHSPLLDADAALSLSRQLRRMALRLKQRTGE